MNRVVILLIVEILCAVVTLSVGIYSVTSDPPERETTLGWTLITLGSIAFGAGLFTLHQIVRSTICLKI